MMKKFEKLNDVNWLNIINMLLGAVLLSLYFKLNAANFFSTFELQLSTAEIVNSNYSFAWWNKLLVYTAVHSTPLLLQIMQFTLLVTALGLLLGVLNEICLVSASIIFLILFLSKQGMNTTWTFEYFMPLSVCCLATYGSWRSLLDNFSVRKLCMGSEKFKNSALVLHIIVIILCTVLYYGAHHISTQLAIKQLSILTTIFCATLLGNITLDKMRQAQHSDNNHTILNMMIVLIGIMLTFQVIEDLMLNWFTVSGYSQLANFYALQSSAPAWYRALLAQAANGSYIIMPIQYAVETCLGVFLITLVARAPALLVTAILCSILTIAEFGVPAVWPATVNTATTWTWELLFTSIMSVLLFLYAMGKFSLAQNAKARWLGDPIFVDSSLSKRALIALSISGIIALVVWLGNAPHDHVTIITLETGVKVFLYLLISSLIDYGRTTPAPRYG